MRYENTLVDTDLGIFYLSADSPVLIGVVTCCVNGPKCNMKNRKELVLKRVYISTKHKHCYSDVRMFFINRNIFLYLSFACIVSEDGDPPYCRSLLAGVFLNCWIF